MSLNTGDTRLNNLLKFMSCLVTVSTLLWLPNSSASAQSDNCDFLVVPQAYSTIEKDDRIVIGQLSDRPYIVLQTYDLEESLPAIRTCIPDAFLTSSRLGRYIHVASFDNYSDANELTESMHEFLDIDVRIMHRTRLGH